MVIRHLLFLKKPFSSISKVFLSLLLSGGLVYALYGRINWSELIRVFDNASLSWLTVTIAMVILIMLISAWRWHRMVREEYCKSFAFDLYAFVSSKALNLFIPAKLGEFSRSYILRRRANVPLDRSVALTLLERVLDVSFLLLFVVLGVIVSTDPSPVQKFFVTIAVIILFVLTVGVIGCCKWQYKQELRFGIWGKMVRFWQTIFMLPKRVSAQVFAETCCYTFLLWTLHLLHFQVMFLVFNHQLSVQEMVSYVPIAILAGQAPVTVAGVGTRDAALVYFLSDSVPIPVLAGVSLLAVTRVLCSGMIGILTMVIGSFFISKSQEG
ncbi:MAG: lysylphosphatidylglycerol synthase transmembrane domain-containing protein [Bacteroidota bacterium]